MQKKKDRFLDKIVKKNYHKELEEVLEEREFDESVKNILLSILYKIEAAYKDVETVKKNNVETKEEYIENFIDTIKNKCEEIKIVRPNTEESKKMGNRTYLIENNKILCYPIERKILYAIAKIQKQDEIIKENYFVIHKTLSDTINNGNNINMVEPLRDFNGFSWSTIAKEMESIPHNIVYQNLRILLGYKFLNNWIKNQEFIIDYMERFENELETKYGKKYTRELLKNLEKISILLEAKFDKQEKIKLYGKKKEIEESLNKIKNKEEFLQEKTKEKKELTEKIKEIDTIINNKELLEKEYIKRNEELPLEKKIFSMRILSQIMEKERDKIIEKIEKCNELMNPQKFIEYENELLEKKEILAVLEENNDDNTENEDENKENENKNIDQNIENENKNTEDKKIDENIIKLQKTFLECFNEKIKRAEAKNEIIDLIYEMRYYCFIPFSEDQNMIEVRQLKKQIEKNIKTLIEKAITFKIINNFSQQPELNYEILKNIFQIRIIKLEEIYIKITKEKENIYIQLFDENIFEEKVKIGTKETIKSKDLEIKFNKAVKLFN